MDKNPIINDDLRQVTLASLPWERLRNKTVLISGGAGFLASYVTKSLLAANRIYNLRIKVICLVRGIGGAESRLADFIDSRNLSIIKHDVNNSLLGLVPRAEFFIHSASQASPKYYGIDPVGTLLPNSVGTLNLLEHARYSNAEKFLFFSSGEVYGVPVDPNKSINESDYGYLDPMNVRSCYAESKRIGETMCVAWSKQYGLDASIVRPFHTYGPGISLDDGRVFADFIADILAKRDIVLKSNGLARRPFCYLSDATIGFLTVLLKGKAAEAYNVGNPMAEVSMLDLANTISQLIPERAVGVRFEVADTSSQYLKSPIARSCPSIEKIKKIGWIPTTSIEDGFRKTINSFLT